MYHIIIITHKKASNLQIDIVQEKDIAVLHKYYMVGSVSHKNDQQLLHSYHDPYYNINLNKKRILKQ